MRLTQSDAIKDLSKEDKTILKEMCGYANNLYNAAIYNIHRYYEENGTYLSYYTNRKMLHENENFKMLQASIADYVIRGVDEAYKSFFESKKENSKAQVPGYRPKGNLYRLTFPRKDVVLKDGFLRIPMSRDFKKTHPGVVIRIPCRLERLEDKEIKQIIILPINDGEEFKINYSYELDEESTKTNKSNILAIDIGVNNLASCVTTLGDSFIIDGKRLKSVNQGWNKEKARLQSIAKKQGLYTTKKIQRITQNRNNKVKDIMFKSARYIVDYCIANDIGTIVLGYNIGFKKSRRIGKKNTQNFQYIPYTDLRNQLTCLCQRYGMTYIEHNEAYTSQSSFLDGDPVPEFCYQKQGTYDFSGDRVTRGLYVASDGTAINADINAAANILRKTIPDYDEEGLRKGALHSPPIIRLN